MWKITTQQFGRGGFLLLPLRPFLSPSRFISTGSNPSAEASGVSHHTQLRQSFLFFNYSYCTHLCVCELAVCGESQRTPCRTWLSQSALWVLGIELRLSELVASTGTVFFDGGFDYLGFFLNVIIGSIHIIYFDYILSPSTSHLPLHQTS